MSANKKRSANRSQQSVCYSLTKERLFFHYQFLSNDSVVCVEIYSVDTTCQCSSVDFNAVFSCSCVPQIVCVNHFTCKISYSYRNIRSICQFERNFRFFHRRVRENVYLEISLIFVNTQCLVRNTYHHSIWSSKVADIVSTRVQQYCLFFSSLCQTETRYIITTVVASHN